MGYRTVYGVSNIPVDNPVDILRRHADRTVRKLRTRVGTRQNYQ